MLFRSPANSEPLIPAQAISFSGTDLRQVLLIYSDLAGADLDGDDALLSLPAQISFTNMAAVSRAQAIQLLDDALLNQAGIVVTHPQTNRAVMRLVH